jgi:hypothetical protein
LLAIAQGGVKEIEAFAGHNMVLAPKSFEGFCKFLRRNLVIAPTLRDNF